MSYKILTKNAIENTNIDGARGEFFNSGNRDGIVKGTLNEGKFFASAKNTIAFESCELRISGHRVVIDAPITQTFTSKPAGNTRYSFVAQIVVDDNSNVAFSTIIQPATTALTTDNLFETTTGAGTYQVEIGKFTLNTDGEIEDVVRTLDVITGGASCGGADFEIGDVTTNEIDYTLPAEVDIDKRYDTQQKQTFIDVKIQSPTDFSELDERVNSAVSTANSAETKSTNAVGIANGADKKSDTAVSTANTANANSQTAITTANTANTKSESAISTANSAKSTADSANETATEAKTIANSASAKADSKVDKVEGKQLSTNDYTDEDKANVASNTTARHTHENKSLLDTYTQTETNLADAVSKKHSHSNKALLDTYDQTNDNLTDAVSKKHSHTNKTILDGTTASYTTVEKTKLAGLENYDDTEIKQSIANETTARTNADSDLQSQINTNKTNITNLTTTVSGHTTSINSLEDSVETNTTNIATNTADIATNATNIATNTADIETNTSDIATNTANIATNTKNIATNTTNITKNTASIKTNADNIATNTSDITSLKTSKLDASNANTNVMTQLGVTATDDNVTLNKSYKNLSTQTTSSASTNIPLANDTTAGLMSKADYAQIRENTERIEQLEGQNIRLLYTASDSPTASQIETFVKAEGYTDTAQWPQIGVVVSETNHIWRYYTNTTAWKDIGVDTVNTFTNTVAGIIKGSSTAGKVYAETDGTGSVYGWDSLNTKVTNNASAISTETSNRTSADNALQTNIDNEKTARESADTTLQGNIDSEASTRASADTNLQTQIDGKQATITGGATTITADNLATSRALISNSSGKVAVSDITSTELGYLDNVTSNIQTQLNGKQASLTTAQQNAVNSGITSDLVTQITTNKNNIATNTTNIAKKLETSNIKAGANITITTSGNDVTVNAVAEEGGSVVNIDGTKAPIVNFDSDPQTQITANATAISTLQTNVDNKMDKTNPTGTGAFSLNRKANTEVGQYSFAEGSSTTASGNSSHAEGGFTIASGDSSHAEGNSTTASGQMSHAEGEGTTASGRDSHAEGGGTVASGAVSHAEGEGTTANHLAQHVFGEYNILDSSTAASTARGTYVEIVGNGVSSSTRSNARTLDWSGNEVLAGTLTINGSGAVSYDSTTDTFTI